MTGPRPAGRPRDGRGETRGAAGGRGGPRRGRRGQQRRGALAGHRRGQLGGGAHRQRVAPGARAGGHAPDAGAAPRAPLPPRAPAPPPPPPRGSGSSLPGLGGSWRRPSGVTSGPWPMPGLLAGQAHSRAAGLLGVPRSPHASIPVQPHTQGSAAHADRTASGPHTQRAQAAGSEGHDLECARLPGARQTCQKELPDHYEFSIRTPVTPARWADYEQARAGASRARTLRARARGPPAVPHQACAPGWRRHAEGHCGRADRCLLQPWVGAAPARACAGQGS